MHIICSHIATRITSALSFQSNNSFEVAVCGANQVRLKTDLGRVINIQFELIHTKCFDLALFTNNVIPT